MAVRGGRKPTDPSSTSGGSSELAARRLTPVDSAALSELAAKVDRLIVMAETVSSPTTVGAGGTDTLRAELRAEMRAAFTDLAQQLQASLSAGTQRLSEETLNLRGGLQLALEEAQRRQAQDQETLRAGVQAAFTEIVLRQGKDREAVQAQLRAALAESRDHVRTELQAMGAQLLEQRSDSQEQLRAALESATGDQKLRQELIDQRRELSEQLESLRTALGPAPQEARQRELADLGAALAGRDERLAAFVAERSDAVQVQLRAAVDEVVRQQEQRWEARRAELEAALADGNDHLQQALAEENARLRALEATLVGQAGQTRRQWRADLEAALTTGRDVGMALVAEATERLVALGEEVAASIISANEERSRDHAEQMNDLQAAFEDLTAAIGLERRELRAAVEAGLDTSEIVGRIDALTASTAKGAADVATAIDKVRRQPRADSRVSDVLMELYEELERIRKKIPTRGEIRLADDQVTAIVGAVKSARPRPAPAPAAAKAPVKKAPRARPTR